jgi:hypothetical protein
MNFLPHVTIFMAKQKLSLSQESTCTVEKLMVKPSGIFLIL